VSSIFSRIIAGDIPGRFVWQDDDVVAFLTAAPLTDGHTLVVPRAEVDRWTDAPGDLLAKLTAVAQLIGRAQVDEFSSARAGLTVMGFEVHHLHLHVWPVNSMSDYDFTRVENNPDPARLDANAERLREGLRRAGHGTYVPSA
jgi:diadenosine tetraphosphate (Ap4A) HIT family hydrolase